MRIEFTQQGTFQALYAAQAWCRENGISFGSSCAMCPTGLLFGDWAISKWRNLSPRERSELHGAMSGNFREGPVIIEIKDWAAAAHGITGTAAPTVQWLAPDDTESGAA